MKMLQEDIMLTAEDLIVLEKNEKASIASGYRQGLLVGVLSGYLTCLISLKILGMI